MIQCKRCQSESTIKNGIVRGKPRYKCKKLFRKSKRC